MPGLRSLFEEHDRWIDNYTGAFDKELQGILAAAVSRTVAALRDQLKIRDGVILQTAANARVLRTVDRLLAKAMNRAGYGALVQEFVDGFSGQLPFFDSMLDQISATLDRPLVAKYTAADRDAFASLQVSTADALESVMTGAAAKAQRKALFSVGALGFSDVVEGIATSFSRSISESQTLGATATSMFFRTIQDRGFASIEKGLKKGAVRYRFDGPRDKLTRPFCERMLRTTRTRPLTRVQIEGLENGQLPNPFVTGGGYNCRHQWVITEIKG
jgi:hypothetical protein